MSRIGAGIGWTASTMRSALMRLIDGQKQWGDVVIAEYPRAMWVQYRVTVYPPGITLAERRSMQVARRWPLAGALLTSISALVLAASWPTFLSVAGMVVVYLAGIGITRHLTADTRHRSLRIHGSFVQDGGRVETLGDGTLVVRALKTFDELDRRRELGRMTEAEFEFHGARAYEALAMAQSARSRPDHAHATGR